MAGKMRIIVMVVLAAGIFGASYFLSSWLAPTDRPVPRAAAGDEAAADLARVVAPALAPPVSIAMKQRELDELIKELRLKIDACRNKQDALDRREKRIEMAGEILKKQAQELEALRMQLVTPLTQLRDAKADLENTRIRIDRQEQASFKRTATICDKMDAASGSEMLTRMCKNGQVDDVVRILRFMSERTAAKLLGAMTDKDLQADLCERMKKVVEKDRTVEEG